MIRRDMGLVMFVCGIAMIIAGGISIINALDVKKHRLETTDVDEAREFARYCERVSDSYRMIPVWDNEYDNQRPVGYVIICAENP